MFQEYDVIVVGAGHAGCEAAAAAANLGVRTLLVTMNMNNMAQMSCNPAMGGIAKGQIVREIDALGGQAGIITDKTMIQFKMLNRSKGPAMWSPRAQSDRFLFCQEWRDTLEKIEMLDFFQDAVVEVIVEEGKAVGVRTGMGHQIYSKTIILTNGTFLNGIIHIGTKQFGGGRIGEGDSKGITESLVQLGFRADRMKTGTPVRVDGRTIDFSVLEEQAGDEVAMKFSYLDTPKLTTQRSCYMAYTSEEVHDILRTGFADSPMFNGRIQGVGPRYCPSIEDKIERFSDKLRHQLFVEPEGWNTIEYYINGFSSSLPEEVQVKALRKIRGFENAKIFRPGYAIEYDYFPPEQLQHTLETKLVSGLYFAGQINGTTGYEEAGSQGLMAGINAALKVKGEEPFILGRAEAYIGVLIDDLITKGVDEPYRMFTSRAEYRILLRQDNADQRLTKKAYDIGLASQERLDRMIQKQNEVKAITQFLMKESAFPDEINTVLEACETSIIKFKTKMSVLLSRPQVHLNDMIEALPSLKSFVDELSDMRAESLESAEILLKYENYIKKEQDMADKLKGLEEVFLKDDFDYHALQSLSTEARQKLSKIRPRSLGQASRISGVSPSDISVLAVYLGR